MALRVAKEILKKESADNEESKSVKMSKEVRHHLDRADPVLGWSLFRKKVFKKILKGDMTCEGFIVTPYIDDNSSFDLLSVFYKPKMKVKLADFYYIDNLRSLLNNDKCVDTKLDNIETTNDIDGKLLKPTLFYREAGVSKGSQLKSCEIMVKGFQHSKLLTDLTNKYYIDLANHRLENAKRLYIITEVIKADELNVKTLVQPAVYTETWADAVIAFKYKKFEIDDAGKIAKEVETDRKRTVQGKGVIWHTM